MARRRAWLRFSWSDFAWPLGASLLISQALAEGPEKPTLIYAGLALCGFPLYVRAAEAKQRRQDGE